MTDCQCAQCGERKRLQIDRNTRMRVTFIYCRRCGHRTFSQESARERLVTREQHQQAQR